MWFVFNVYWMVFLWLGMRWFCFGCWYLLRILWVILLGDLCLGLLVVMIVLFERCLSVCLIRGWFVFGWLVFVLMMYVSFLWVIWWSVLSVVVSWFGLWVVFIKIWNGWLYLICLSCFEICFVCLMFFVMVVNLIFIVRFVVVVSREVWM